MLLLIILEVWILEHMPLKKYFFSLRLIGMLLFPFFERQNRALLIILSFQFIPCKINIEEFYIPGIGNGNPLQYSCLQIPWTEEHGRLQFMGVTKESDTTEQLSTHVHSFIHSWPLSNMSLNCMWPHMHKFYLKVNTTVQHILRLVELLEVEPQKQRNHGYGEATVKIGRVLIVGRIPSTNPCISQGSSVFVNIRYTHSMQTRLGSVHSE